MQPFFGHFIVESRYESHKKKAFRQIAGYKINYLVGKNYFWRTKIGKLRITNYKLDINGQ